MTREILPGKYKGTIEGDEPYVLFIIGARLNRGGEDNTSWTLAMHAMAAMIEHLEKHPDLGLLRVERYLQPPRATVLQYWRSLDHLMHFAHAPMHRGFWRQFEGAVGDDDSVGLWHETHVVIRHESIYFNVPETGIGAAGILLPVAGNGDTAEARLNQS